jgi:hypothetical protein
VRVKSAEQRRERKGRREQEDRAYIGLLIIEFKSMTKVLGGGMRGQMDNNER